MFKVPPERPVDAIVVDILANIEQAARRKGFDYFLVGATARDIILTHVFDAPVTRATRDVDLAVAIDGWPQFNELKQHLLTGGRFVDDDHMQSRLIFDPDPNGIAYPVDLIPYGGVEDAAHSIAWPPDGAVLMNLAGYADARAAADEVEIAPGLIVPVVSPAGLAMLKLFSWNDHPYARQKDAQDLYFFDARIQEGH